MQSLTDTILAKIVDSVTQITNVTLKKANNFARREEAKNITETTMNLLNRKINSYINSSFSTARRKAEIQHTTDKTLLRAYYLSTQYFNNTLKEANYTMRKEQALISISKTLLRFYENATAIFKDMLFNANNIIRKSQLIIEVDEGLLKMYKKGADYTLNRLAWAKSKNIYLNQDETLMHLYKYTSKYIALKNPS